MLGDFIKGVNIFIFDRKLIREIDSLEQQERFWVNSIAITSWDNASRDEVSKKILSIKWGLIIAEINRATPGTKRASVLSDVVNKHNSNRLLILSDSYEISDLKRVLGISYTDFETTKWGRKDFLVVNKPIRQLRLKIFNYERTREESHFINLYVNLSKWLSNKKIQNKIRSRLVSSSLFAAEESLRYLRNRLVHGNINDLLIPKEAGREFIKDEELLGDINSEEIDKRFTNVELTRLMDNLSETLECLDQIQVDSKFNALIKNINEFRQDKHRIWIYAAYKSTITYLYSSIREMIPYTYQIHGQMSSYQIVEAIDLFTANGGILIASLSLLKGFDLPIDTLILYDIPDNENLVFGILSRALFHMSIEGSEKPINIYALNDGSGVLKSEEIRLQRFQEYVNKIFNDSVLK
jgi:hypothetical protein